MFFNNSDNDSYENLRRREEYERQRQANFARGIGHFLYLYLVYSFIWFFSSILISMLLTFIFGLNQLIATIIGMISGFILFKVPYIKQEPIKSLITIGFMFFLISVAFPQSS
jgi:hypothetical protein